MGGFRRFDLREATARLLAEIPVYQVRRKEGIEFGMLPLEIDQKPAQTSGHQSQAAQTPHVGLFRIFS